MKSIRATLVALSVGVAVAISVPAPASANSFTTCLMHAGKKAACAQWKDASDQLCLRDYAVPSVSLPAVEIRNSSGRRVKYLSSASADIRWVCTGNLSVPEDARFTLELFQDFKSGHVTKRVNFYT